jgi:hypothetical protein
MSTNWIKNYGRTRKFQEGGAMAPAGAPAGASAGQGGAPDLEGMLMEYAQTRDPNLAVAIADALVEMLAAQQGAAGAQPQGQAGPPMAKIGSKTSKAPIFRK